MKIGIEVQRLFRKKKFGIETSSLELIKKLSQVDRKYEFVIFAKDDEDRACLAESDNLKIKTLNGKFFADFEQVFLPIAARNERIDILHCTGNTAPYFSPVPVVQTLHDVIFLDQIPETDTLYQRVGNQYRRKVVPHITPRSKAVITVSKYEKERIVSRLGIAPEKLHVIYNGINEARFNNYISPNQLADVKSRLGLPDQYILFLGNESHRKNPGRVIEAYVQYARSCADPIPLVTPGLSEAFVAENLSSLDYAYNKDQFVTPGYIPDSDLPAVYTGSQFFIFPSLSEGFGMPIAEAMACGTPVITSNISCMPEIAGKAGILVDPLDSLNIASAILSLSSSEEFRNRKVAEGLVNAKRFNWTQSAKKVLNLYDVVLEQARAEKEGVFSRKPVYAQRN